MQKKSFIFLTILLIAFRINFTSAYYGQDALGNFFETIGWTNLLIVCTFFISLVLLKFILSKTLDKTTAKIISFLLALAITGGFYFAGFNLQELLASIGIYEDALSLLIPIILIVGVIWIIKKFGFGNLLMILGGILGTISFTDWVEQSMVLLIIAVALLIVGFFFHRTRKKKEQEKETGIKNQGFFRRKLNEGTFPGQQRYNQWKDYKKQATEQKYNQKLAERQKDYEDKQHKKEVLERAKKIEKIREKRENNEEEAKKKELEKQKMQQEISQEEQRRKSIMKNINKEIQGLSIAISKSTISAETKQNYILRIKSLEKAKKNLTRFKRKGSIWG